MESNPVLVKFSNEQLRRVADRIESLRNFLNEQFDRDPKTGDAIITDGPVQQFIALDIASLINDPSAVIDDGSDKDGRASITGQDLIDVMNLAQKIQTFLSGEKTIAAASKAAVNARM